MFIAVSKNDFPSVKLLLEHGALLNVGDKDGLSPLNYALINKNEEIAKYLLDHGAFTNSKDNKGFSVLQYTMMLKTKIDIVKQVIANGAFINTNANKGGESALMLAIYYNNIEGANFLLELDPDINVKSSRGITAVDYAIILNNISVLKKMKELHVFEKLTDENKKHSLEIAKKYYDKEVNELLKNVLIQ